MRAKLTVLLAVLGLSATLGASAIDVSNLGPGVYLVMGDVFISLSPAPITETQQKKSNMMSFSANVKGKKQYTSKINGGKAGVRTQVSNAAFYFRGVDAKDLILVRLDSGKKEREFTSSTTTMGLRNIKNMGTEKKAGGVPDKETRPFSVNQIDAMTQEVVVSDLEEGEYAFYDGAKLYDFGVDIQMIATK